MQPINHVTGSGVEEERFLQALRVSIVVMLILLTIQGWTGDFANLFATFPTGSVGASWGGFWQAVGAAGDVVAYHVVEATALLVLSVVVLVLAIRHKTGRLFAILGLTAVLSAAVGGVLFVLSGYQADPNSAQMGGSFIGAYASYFLALYSSKK